MAKEFFKKFHKGAKFHFDKAKHHVVRVWNLAKRLDQSHYRHEKRKKGR